MATTDKQLKDTRRRVKLYVLNDKRVWDDRGTGHVSCVDDAVRGMLISVYSELDAAVLLESKVLSDTAYQKQQETLIVWSEGENYDLALSFQEKLGCDDIWEKICQIQGKDPSVDITQDISYENESDSESGDPVEPPLGAMSPQTIDLPPCDLGNLGDIHALIFAIVNNQAKLHRREKLATALESNGYIKKLLDLFRKCEDLEDATALKLLYTTVRNICLLNKNSIFEILFADDCIRDVIGVLEYDPNVKVKRRHREYLWQRAKFHEVVPITNDDLRSKIHQTYRVQYIQDVIFPAPSMFEENLLSTLNSFIFFNKVEIVSLIQDDEPFLNELFAMLCDDATSVKRRREAVLFLREFCNFSPTLQPPAREAFFKTICNHGIIPGIETCLLHGDKKTCGAAVEIFGHVIEFNPAIVREYILNQSQSVTDDAMLFVNIIIEQIFLDRDPELTIAMQLTGILRILFDPDNMSLPAVARSLTEKTDFLSFFYRRCMGNLCASLLANTADPNGPIKDDYITAHILSIVLDLIMFCVEHHSFHCRNYILMKKVSKRIMVLIKSKHHFLALAALRYLRRIVQIKDEFYLKNIITDDLFKPVVECFKSNGKKYNLLNSAIIELFEFVRQEDIKTLMNYFCEKYLLEFDEIEYVKVFKTIKIKYRQTQEKSDDLSKNGSPQTGLRSLTSLNGNGTPTTMTARFRRDPRMMTEDEENYFNEDDEDLDESIETSLPASISFPVSSVLNNKENGEIDLAASVHPPRPKCPSPNQTNSNHKLSSPPSSPPTTASMTSSGPPPPRLDICEPPDFFEPIGKSMSAIKASTTTVGSTKMIIQPIKMLGSLVSGTSSSSPTEGAHVESSLGTTVSPEIPSLVSAIMSERKSLVDYEDDDSSEEDEGEIGGQGGCADGPCGITRSSPDSTSSVVCANEERKRPFSQEEEADSSVDSSCSAIIGSEGVVTVGGSNPVSISSNSSNIVEPDSSSSNVVSGSNVNNEAPCEKRSRLE